MAEKRGSEMVERVARAIYAVTASDPDWDDAPLTEDQRVDEDDDPSQELCIGLARAAIEAMREPTDEMVREGAAFEYSEGDRNVDVGDYIAEGVWGRMIDEALR